VLLVLLVSTLISSEESIAIGKGRDIDLLSAELLSIFSHKEKSSKKLIIKQTNSPVKSLNNPDITFAIDKGDQVYEASKSMPKLRSIAALYPELLTFITKKESNISSLSDEHLKIGYIDKDTKKTLTYIYEKLNLPISTLIKIDQNQTTKLLNTKEIDAYIGLYEYPSKKIYHDINQTKLKFIQLEGKQYNQLIRSNSFLLKSKIKKDVYNVNDSDITTIGVKTILLTTEDCDDDLVYELTKAILDNLDKFKKLHPVYKNLSKKDLLEELVVPQHKGAIKAFNNMKKGEEL